MVLVTHDRHLLRHTVDELWLVDAGRVSEYSEDVQAYERWVLKREPDAENASAASTTHPQPNTSRKAARQAAAQQREKLRPLKRKIEQTEKAMAAKAAELEAMEQSLADGSLYEDENKSKLDELLLAQGQYRQQHETLEETWLALQEELETLEQPLSASAD